MPTIHRIFHHQKSQKIILYRVWRYGITGGHVNAEGSDHGIKPRVQHNAVTAVNIILTNGRYYANLEYHTVIKRNLADCLQCVADGFRCEGQIFKRGTMSIVARLSGQQ